MWEIKHEGGLIVLLVFFFNIKTMYCELGSVNDGFDCFIYERIAFGCYGAG